jgi:hypothetical protein
MIVKLLRWRKTDKIYRFVSIQMSVNRPALKPSTLEMQSFPMSFPVQRIFLVFQQRSFLYGFIHDQSRTWEEGWQEQRAWIISEGSADKQTGGATHTAFFPVVHLATLASARPYRCRPAVALFSYLSSVSTSWRNGDGGWTENSNGATGGTILLTAKTLAPIFFGIIYVFIY